MSKQLSLCRHVQLTFLRCRGGPVVVNRVIRIYSVKERDILADEPVHNTDSCGGRHATPTPPDGESGAANCLNSVRVYN